MAAGVGVVETIKGNSDLLAARGCRVGVQRFDEASGKLRNRVHAAQPMIRRAERRRVRAWRSGIKWRRVTGWEDALLLEAAEDLSQLAPRTLGHADPLKGLIGDRHEAPPLGGRNGQVHVCLLQRTAGVLLRPPCHVAHDL